MRRYIIDVAGLAGLGLIAAGSWLQFGASVSMLVTGSLMLSGALMAARSAAG
jgi:hypothetical protein